MIERPILYSPPMAKAVYEERKSMTRRVIKPQPRPDAETKHVGDTFLFYRVGTGPYAAATDYHVEMKCPYGVPGDILWAREKWRTYWSYDDVSPLQAGRFYSKPDLMPVEYSDGVRLHWGDEKPGRWRSSLHMPRSASRSVRVVTEIRLERLQDISNDDAIAEGLAQWLDNAGNYTHYGIAQADVWERDPRLTFKRLWESIHGAGSWEINPWLFVIAFGKAD